ncbi:MAG: zf-HC2 domain-containing protein [Planctomycetes bacterium]|nr:zf-HC2 domain-containing protein [Planctomycetota bacterium]
MPCEQVRERWLLLAEDGLGKEEREAVQAHLDGCPACRSECEAIGSLQGDLDEALAPQAGQEAAIRDLVGRLADVPLAAAPSRHPWPRVWLGALAVAAAVVLAAKIIPHSDRVPGDQTPRIGASRGGGMILAKAPDRLPPEIVRMFEDPEEAARLYAARRIGGFGDAAMSGSLGEVVMDDPSPRVRRAAVAALRAVWARAEGDMAPPRLAGTGS